MAFLPLDTVKLFVDLFDVIYLRYHKVEKIDFDSEGLEKIYVVDDELVLLVSIVKNRSIMALNEKELFWKAHGPGNRFVRMPSESEIYYQLEIEELTPNTVGFRFVKREYIDRLEMLTGLYHLSLDVDYVRFRGWRRPDWNPKQELTVERVNRLRPALRLKERFEKWEGYGYHFAIMKLPRRGKSTYIVAYFTAAPKDYLKRFADRYRKTGTISSEIRGGYGFPNKNRRKNLEKMVVSIKDRHFREKDDVWRYADKLLLKARKGEFDDYRPLESMVEHHEEPRPEIDLDRFLEAQDFRSFGRDGEIEETNYERAMKELKRGRKETHWMWFIFPQLKGLGWSELANKYGIRSIHEAIAYFEHPVLRERLIGATKAVNKHKSGSLIEIFGFTDSMKFHSCLTLFLEVDPQNRVLLRALDQFFAGYRDPKTMALLRQFDPDIDDKEM